MIWQRFYIVIFILFIYPAFAQKSVSITSANQIIDGTSSISILNDPQGKYTITDVTTYPFVSITKPGTDALSTVQWLSIPVENKDSIEHDVYISLVFIDYIDFYIPSGSDFKKLRTGDMIALTDRNVPVGQMCLTHFTIPANSFYTCYARLESTTALSKQFRAVALRSIKLYTHNAFIERFETSRIYQALFYGAIAIMFLYNLFIYFSIRSKSYLVYVGFLFALLLFLMSNNGYIEELFLTQYPSVDLYIRFISPPLLILFFIFFTKAYLHTRRMAPKLNTTLNFLILCCVLIPLIMIFGYWYAGRLLMIFTALSSFLFISAVSIYIFLKGYKPARYFLIGNILLIIGAIFYCLERYEIVSHNLISQYAIQLSVVFQSIFFSIGLADRINSMKHQLLEVQLENEQLETLRQLEKQKLAEEKNIELQKSNDELDTFIYRTAHDIRGPIARLMGLCNVGIIDVTDPIAKEYLERMKQNSDNLNYIVSRLSTAYEVKNAEAISTTIGLSKILNNVLSTIKFHEEYSNVIIQLNIPDDLYVYTDYKLFRFILLNLIDNGMKFRKHNISEPSVITIYTERRNEETIVYVSDNGIGITEENAPYIFDMFSKAAGSHQTPGLGLYISALCAEKIHAKIHLNRNCSPTIFSVSIPALKDK